jgi:LysR family transcriptional activator of mexEF-oprN operon
MPDGSHDRNGYRAVTLAGVDLNLLKVFDALTSEGSVTLAAGKIGLTQPATSNALNRLRHLFADELFVRTPDGMQPTARARQLASPIRRALQEIRGALESAPFFDPATARRAFTIGLADITALHIALVVAADLYRQAPGIDLRCRAIDAKEAPHLLDTAEIDVAVGILPEQSPRLRSRHLWSMKGRVLACANHPGLRDGLPLALFTALPHVVVSPLGLTSEVLDKALAERGITRRVALIVPSPLALPFVLPSTDRIAILPERLAEGVARSGGLRNFPIPLALPSCEVSLVWHGRDDHDPAQEWLRGLIIEAGSNGEPTPRRPTPHLAAALAGAARGGLLPP